MSNPIKEYSRLMVNGNRSFFQSSNEMRRDSILQDDQDNMVGVSENYSHLKFSVESIGDSIVYNEKLVKHEYQYSEILDFDWVINLEETKEISGYKCYNASTNYGGREWNAWYTPELPLNTGPYKFKGLPGLILEIEDSTKSYRFIFNRFLNEKGIEQHHLTRYYHFEDADNRVYTDRVKFNEIKIKLSNMSFDEKLDYLSQGENGSSNVEYVSYEVGGNRDVTLRSKPKKSKTPVANPIEIVK